MAMEQAAGFFERTYVWELPVRVTHWLNGLAILVLCGTGFYMGDPILGGSDHLMTWMRVIHLVSGYVLVASLALRAYWALEGNRWASWRVFLPYLTAEGWRGMKDAFLYYTFIRRRPPDVTGHNALAAMAYSAVWFLLLVQIVTGFAMLSLSRGGWWSVSFGWVFAIMSPQGTHLLHHMIMWLLLGFIVHHIYSAVLIGLEEKNGLMTSIFSGYKFIRHEP